MPINCQEFNHNDQQTGGLILRLKNNILLCSIGVIVSEKFCFRKCVCLLFTSHTAKSAESVVVSQFHKPVYS